MGVIAKYKFNNTLEANLLPEFNSEFTSDLYTVTDEVNGEVTTRTIESDELPTRMRFGSDLDTYVEGNELALLEVLDMNTKGLTSCRKMFRYCKNLTGITCEWDTSNVTDMNGMFYGCYKLTTLDVSNWNTSKVTSMHQMFYDCNNLASLDVSNWNTSKVTSMNHLFELCKSLTYLDLRSFDTSSVTSMYYMFANCPKLISIDISTFIINENTNIGQYFANTNNLKYLKCNNVSTLNTLNTLLPTKTSDNPGTIICKSDITNLDTTALQSKYWNILDEPTLIAKYVFDKSIHNNCIPEFNTEFEGYFIEDEVVEGNSEVTRTIESCGMLPTLMKFTTANNQGLNADGRELALLHVEYINNTNFNTEYLMFRSCSNLMSVKGFVSNIMHDLKHTFTSCNNLITLDLISSWDTSRVTDMSYLFYGCNNLTSLDLSNWDTSQVTNMNAMFYGCRNLTSLDLSNWNSSLISIHHIFYDCRNLTTLDISNLNMINVTETANMFYNTPLLTDIGVLYMDKSSLQKLVDVIPTNLNKTLWYKDVNIDGITHGDNITLKKYMEGNVEIVLNSPLLEGDTIEVKDGKLCHVHRYEKIVLNSSEGWRKYPSFTLNEGSHVTDENLITYCHEVLSVPDAGWNCTISYCNNFLPGQPYDQYWRLFESVGVGVGQILICTYIPTLEDFKQWLSENPTTVIYQRAEPYYEDITNLQSAPTLKTYLECSMEIDTDLPIDTNVTYRTNLSSVYVMERELDELDNGTDLGDILEGEVNE